MKVPNLKRKHVYLILAAILILPPVGVALLIVAADMLVNQQAPNVYQEPGDLPPHRVGLVLGTSKTVHGRPNRYFTTRIDAAAALYEAGKVEVFLVSGDNSTRGYNEPQDMQEALIAKGIPADRIYHDYAGFSTLDSMLRAKRVFGLEAFVVISQAFHCERALFIANAHGIDALGYAAADVQGIATTRIRIREYLARVKAVLDVYVLRRNPKYLGDDPYGLGDL